MLLVLVRLVRERAVDPVGVLFKERYELTRVGRGGCRAGGVPRGPSPTTWKRW